MLLGKSYKIDAIFALDGFSVTTQAYTEVISSEKTPGLTTQSYTEVISSEKTPGLTTQTYVEVISTI